MKKIILQILTLIVIPLVMEAQVTDDEEYLQEIIESLSAVSDDESSHEEIYNSLLQLQENPVDINRAGRDELYKLFFLNDRQVDSILRYRELHGPFLEKQELFYVNGLEPGIVKWILPFIDLNQVHPEKSLKPASWLADSRVSVMARYSATMEKKSGFEKNDEGVSHYLGKPGRYVGNIKLNVPGLINSGIAIDRDPGEPFLWAPGRNYFGFDHYSYHFTILERGVLKNLTLGDYKVQFGQGLVLGNGFYLGKSSESVQSVTGRSGGIRPYSSAAESGFFRGGALTLGKGPFNLTIFLSYMRTDTRLDTTSSESDDFITNLITTGLHRTVAELQNRKNNFQLDAGAHAGFKNNKGNFEMGMTTVYTRFSLPYREKTTYYNQFDFTGTSLQIAGIDYRYFHRRFYVFGETAYSGKGGLGIVNGIMANLSKNIETSLCVRHYDRGLHTLYGNPFRESSSPCNESGIYWGIKILPVKNIALNLYFDDFSFPWLKYNLRRPSGGNELMTKITWIPRRILECYGQVVVKNKDSKQTETGPGIVKAIPGSQAQYRIQARLNFYSGWQLTGRFQASRHTLSNEKSTGMMAYQDIGRKLRFGSLHTRFIWFRTDDFQSRQYEYEQGALYDYQVPSFYGDGIRAYMVFSLKPGKHLRCWVKAGRTLYWNTGTIGSGWDQIRGNHKTEILLQSEYNF